MTRIRPVGLTVVADKSAPADVIAGTLVAHLERKSGTNTSLVSTSTALIADAAEAIDRRCETVGVDRSTLERALRVVLVADLLEAVAVVRKQKPVLLALRIAQPLPFLRSLASVDRSLERRAA